jgi:hypothetical protein
VRPIYETKDDKIRQQFVADAVAEHWQITCVPEPELEENDYRLLKGDKFFAIMEVKFRHGYTWTEMRFMDTYILSLDKWFALWRKCAEHNVALCLAISDKAGEIWAATWRGKPPVYEVRNGGRRDRKDPKDIERLVHIPMDDINVLIRDRDDQPRRKP